MNEEIRNYIKEKLKLVPELPGSYQMKNKDGLIIFSKNGSKILHTNIIIQDSKNIKINNIKIL